MRRSTGRFYAFCAFVFFLGLAASGYLNYYQYQRGLDRQQVDNDTIAQLKRESNLMQTPTPTPVVSALGAKIVKIKELSVSITTLNPLSDLTYQFQQSGGLDGVNFSSASLINATTTCGPGALGRLVRQATDDKAQLPASQLVKQLGTYNFYYVPPKTPCAKDPVSTAALKADNVFMPAILSTLATSQ